MCYRLYIDIIDSYPTVVQNRQLSSQDATGRVHAVSWIRSCHASDLPSALPPHVTYFDIKNVAIIIQYMYDFVKCSPCWGTCSPSNRPGEAQTQHAHGNCLEPWPWKSDSAKRRIQIIYCRLSLILHVHFALLGAAHRQQPYIQSRHNIKTPIRLSMAQLGSWITETGHIPSAISRFQHSLACRIKVACTGPVSITLMPLDEAIAEHLQAKMCSWHPKCAKHINANFQPVLRAYHEPWAPTGSVLKVFSSGFSDSQILLGEASAGLLSQAFHDLTSDLAVCSKASCSLSVSGFCLWNT